MSHADIAPDVARREFLVQRSVLVRASREAHGAGCDPAAPPPSRPPLSGEDQLCPGDDAWRRALACASAWLADVESAARSVTVSPERLVISAASRHLSIKSTRHVPAPTRSRHQWVFSTP
jgi:hypothetical protein